jgi:hypothetical protein
MADAASDGGKRKTPKKKGARQANPAFTDTVRYVLCH